MARPAIACTTAALLGLAACTTYEPPPATPVTSASGAPVVSSSAAYSTALPAGAYRAGTGILESIALVTLPASSASAGGTSAAPAPGPYRLTLRMDDGTVQTLVHDTRAYLVGDRLQVTADGRLIRP